ncbi:MAG: hypothetical protein ACI8ZX_000710 [Planctomycetota bacterium]|jgi:hypothetical protein
MKFELKTFKNPYSLLLLLFVASFLVYLPGIEGRFTSDFYNWVRDYEHGTISELWTCFGYPGLHHLYHIPFYFSYKVFGLNEMAWHIEFTFLHAFNAWLVYFLTKEFLEILKKNNYFAYFTSFLFLLSPFQTEAVAWGATIHYLFTLILFLSAFLYLIKYLKTKENKYLYLFHFLYILDLFTMELPLTFPAIFVLFTYATKNYYQVEIKTIAFKILLIHVLTLLGYFLLTKLIIGSYIGHYGAESHLTFDITLASNALYDYYLKFLSFYRYILPDSLKESLLKLFHNDGFKIISFSLISLTLLKNILFKQQQKISALTLTLLNLVFFAISLLPVLNIEMNSLVFLTTDRYSYVASVFFFIAISISLSFLPKKIGFIIAILYLLLNFVLLNKTVTIWKETGTLSKSIINSYTFYDQKVYALNNIAIHKGAYLFKNGFVAAIELQKDRNIKESYQEIAKVYSAEMIDSVSIKQIDQKITAELIQWGRWFALRDVDSLTYNAHLGYLNQTLIIEPKEKMNIIYLKAGKWQLLKN